MNVVSYRDPAEFWAIALPVVEAEPVLHSVLATVTDSIIKDPAIYPDRIFFAVERDGRHPYLAHHTPPYPIHMPVGDADAARALADHVHAAGRRPRRAGGHWTSVEAFVDRWRELTGQTATVGMRVGLYDLPVDPALPRPVSGQHRVAESGDTALVDEWSRAFHREAIGYEPPPSVTNHASLADGRVMLWCDPEPVAMALATTAHGGVTRIGSVYTPPEHRGRGYGSAVTAAISRDRRALGLTCMLYTDLDNPTSNGIYRAIGYRHLGDTADIEFVDPSE